MISIIICSRGKKISTLLEQNIQNTIGTEFEIILIDNSENKYFITQAYNKGIEQSKFDNLCFIHEDIEFKTSNWGNILISHLNQTPQGIIGVAGGQLATQAPSSWSVSKITRRNNFMQYGTMISFPPSVKNKAEEVVMLDGFFLSCKKGFIDPIRFDDTLHCFHAYDADICFRSKANGGTNFVIYDLLIDHKSHGCPNRQWAEYTKKTFEKWNHMLPIYVGTENVDITQIERKNLKKFVRKMIKLGCSYSDVIEDSFLVSLWRKINNNEILTLKVSVLFYLLFRRIL